MSKLPLVLRELHRSETSLARDLLAVADRHQVDHEIFHVGRDIAAWSQTHVRLLSEIGHDHGLELDPAPRWTVPALSSLTRRLSTATVHRPESGLLLLADLRRVHRKAAGVSLDWELLAQSAQAMRQGELLALAQSCHPRTVRQMKWANAHLKASSPQIIAS
ncbi:hypothetical protein GCM10017691_10860 [Pseudonocardia petroleophila]|uniref:Uncharacterized protein n=1 Tax=Pseudonocardia petroleophila TaxID=37331 RepID=A0A7G7MIZ2_9PSEU|nr:hypothetical protein [Pseudonocardia petroleophila]QNG52753.1 hypothetical protein H6H00_01410 [Pseudonocardia petroleophila]